MADTDQGQGDVEVEEHVVRSTRTVSASPGRVWTHIIESDGMEALLGPGAVLGSKGESWRSTDGPHGVVRSFHPLEQLRVSWHADDNAPASLVDLHLIPDGEGTRLDLVHERLSPADPEADLQVHWDTALARFAEGL